MNFIQRNPNDPKYQEFHDGEYEYWPTDSAIKAKSISIPAAVVSGLELIAAAAAAGLLAVVMAVLYVTSSPLMIGHNSATINANVYNNSENQRIEYTLSTLANPERILLEGMLEDNEDTLDLKNLSSGTEYLLMFYDADRNEIGKNQFTTLGQPGQQDAPEPGSQDSPEIIPDASATEPSETEATTEPDPETEPEIEPETTPEDVFVPGFGGGDDTPYNPPAPAPAPEPEETVPKETEPEPTAPPMEAFSPEVEEIVYTDPYDPMDSGNTDDAYFEITEVYVFINVPADHSVTVLQNGQKLENVLTNHSDDGTLIVTVYGNPVHYGETMKTSVTVKSGNNSIEQGSTFTPPYLMKEATLDMVEETADDSTTYTFTITAHTRAGSNEKMVCEAELHTMLGDDYVLVPLFEVSPGMYVGTYRVTTTAWPVENPFAIISGYWDKIPEGTYYQEALALYDPA